MPAEKGSSNSQCCEHAKQRVVICLGGNLFACLADCVRVMTELSDELHDLILQHSEHTRKSLR